MHDIGVMDQKKTTKIKRFEELRSWQEAISLAKDIYQLTNNGKFSKDFGLRDQIRRATVSISANIAEGFERRSKKEYVHFLSIAKGSAGEVRSLLRVAFEVGYVEEDEYHALKSRLIRISQMLANQMKVFRHNAHRTSTRNNNIC
jgi:four helix bundle protein